MTESELLAELRAGAERNRIPTLGIMGGTFDPVHVGHTAMADAAVEKLGLDGMLYIPAGDPSFKRGRVCAPAADRLAMVRLAVGDRPRCAVSSREIDRGGITYTVDTLEELASLCPPTTRLVFVLGTDSLQTLPLWNRARRIAELAEICVVPRAGHDIHRVLEALDKSGMGFVVHPIIANVPDVSSTRVRELLARGESVCGLVDPHVESYMEERGLYPRAW